jgi:hypothetical protein
LYASSNIVSVIKSKRMRWVGYVTRTGGMWHAYNSLENLTGRDHSEDLSVDGRC